MIGSSIYPFSDGHASCRSERYLTGKVGVGFDTDAEICDEVRTGVKASDFLAD